MPGADRGDGAAHDRGGQHREPKRAGARGSGLDAAADAGQEPQ